MKMIKRLVRVRKVERIFHLPLPSRTVDVVIPGLEPRAEWRYIMSYLR